MLHTPWRPSGAGLAACFLGAAGRFCSRHLRFLPKRCSSVHLVIAVSSLEAFGAPDELSAEGIVHCEWRFERGITCVSLAHPIMDSSRKEVTEISSRRIRVFTRRISANSFLRRHLPLPWYPFVTLETVHSPRSVTSHSRSTPGLFHL